MNNAGLRVIKLGGSLLDLPNLSAAFTRWRERQTPMVDIVIFGGGRLAAEIRRLDDIHRFDGEQSHWLAVQCMSITARIARERLAGGTLTADVAAVSDAPNGHSFWILDPRTFLRDVESNLTGCRLPKTWDATSDSISARLAESLCALELVLLKSTLPEDCEDWHRAAAIGFVDAHFPRAVQRIECAYCVNLIDDAAPVWIPS